MVAIIVVMLLVIIAVIILESKRLVCERVCERVESKRLSLVCVKCFLLCGFTSYNSSTMPRARPHTHTRVPICI